MGGVRGRAVLCKGGSGIGEEGFDDTDGVMVLHFGIEDQLGSR